MRKKLDYNLNWGEYFQIDATSPSGLVRIKNRAGKNIQKYPAGSRLFQKNGQPNGWRLEFKGKHYLVHRIIWVILNYSIDIELVIDHLDGNPFNNSIENLSLKTVSDNTRNRRKHCNNTTGITGVSLMNKGKVYTAQWCDLDGTLKFKYFSILKLGKETAKELAKVYREEQITKLISEGANYTERHGKSVESVLE